MAGTVREGPEISVYSILIYIEQEIKKWRERLDVRRNEEVKNEYLIDVLEERVKTLYRIRSHILAGMESSNEIAI